METLQLLLDKYTPHEVMELLEQSNDHFDLMALMEDYINDSFCEGGVFEDEWRELYGDDSE